MGNVMDLISDTYELLEKLNEGSGGIVYRAYHKRLQKEVVLKKLRNRSKNNDFNRQEADILKNLNHMYIPQILDFLDVGDDIYTVMSYIPGKSFKQLLDAGYPFSRSELITWGMQICSALNYLHSQNPPIIHSDIKPANIMLTPDGNICLIDFNISFYMDENVVLGYSHGYTSPEQYIIAMDKKSVHAIPNHSIVDEKSDIYSVGATFYHLATGERLDKNTRINYEKLIQNLGEVFAQIIIKAIQPNRKERYLSAYEMYKALQSITQRDVRYQQLIRTQKLIRGGLVAGLAGFILLAGIGVRTIHLEHVNAYNELVETQAELNEQRAFKEAEAIHEEAKEILPSGLETYYQQAASLYQQQEYQKCIEFVNYDILLNENLDLDTVKMEEVYYLEALSYFELGNYEEASKAFEQLFLCGGYDCIYYRDYAITLAYNGEFKKAESVLADAIEYGLADDSVYYAKGEIEKAMNQTEDAISHFKQCIAITDNKELLERSYILISKIYEKQGLLKEQRNILCEARERIPVPYQMMILEELVQTDINLADYYEDGRYREEAISVLNKIIKQEWDTYSTYNNLVILNEKQGHLNEAEQVLDIMIQKYGEDYNIYKRKAFLEIDKQELRSNYNRDYAQFEYYYNIATEMYQKQLKNNDTDTEMQLLDNIYQQVRAGGWL